jgi:hypothetical protein
MRRLVSITAIVSLMSSLVSPLLAATCEHGRQMARCHQVQEQKPQNPHCEMMHHHDAAEESAPPTNNSAVTGELSSQNCPMDCCRVGDRSNAVALAASPSLPQPTVNDQSSSMIRVVFTRTGFSSHTDRGPPSA